MITAETSRACSPSPAAGATTALATVHLAALVALPDDAALASVAALAAVSLVVIASALSLGGASVGQVLGTAMALALATGAAVGIVRTAGLFAAAVIAGLLLSLAAYALHRYELLVLGRLGAVDE